jgi:U3 small nucleolar RNA-associated protein 18
MGKHLRKRQRKDRPARKSVAPLGTATVLNDDADKDDEERRLESLLFGRPFASGRGRSVAAIEDAEDDDDEDGTADVTTAELEGMLDSDVSYRWQFRASCLTPLQAFFRGRWRGGQEEYGRTRH